ncbi:MAG: cobalamin B12-binding domain-containing protein [Pseudomonadota bacterium]
MPGCSQREGDATQHDDSRAASASRFDCTGKESPHGRTLGGLIATIESEVIPRLLLSKPEQQLVNQAPPEPTGAHVSAASVDVLVDALLRDEAVEPLIDAHLAQDVPVEQIYSQLLAGAAHELGERWERDGASFADVTVAVGRLQQLLRELSYDFLGATRCSHPRRSILLAPCPGEQHLFGTLMVCEYFRRAGWEVATLPGADLDELASTVANDWFAVVGLSAGSTRQLDSLAATIRAIRRMSANRAIGIMAGGPAFTHRPELVARVGADAGAEQAREAPARAEQLLGLLAADCRV